MKTTNNPARVSPVQKTARGVAAGLPALLIALSLVFAGRGDAGEGADRRAIAADRFNHGSVRHEDSYLAPRHDFADHRDVDADVHRARFWDDFVYGRVLAVLPPGFIPIQVNGAPYFYFNGIYFQTAPGGYEEVYPPVNAAVPQPPDGSVEVDVGGQTYYYAGGAFYVQPSYGVYSAVTPPMGAVVPELPPGAVQVQVKGSVAYQFNGISYEPVFVNGVTQYETFQP